MSNSKLQDRGNGGQMTDSNQLTNANQALGDGLGAASPSDRSKQLKRAGQLFRAVLASPSLSPQMARAAVHGLARTAQALGSADEAARYQAAYEQMETTLAAHYAAMDIPDGGECADPKSTTIACLPELTTGRALLEKHGLFELMSTAA
jgi:hypothetical protein